MAIVKDSKTGKYKISKSPKSFYESKPSGSSTSTGTWSNPTYRDGSQIDWEAVEKRKSSGGGAASPSLSREEELKTFEQMRAGKITQAEAAKKITGRTISPEGDLLLQPADRTIKPKEEAGFMTISEEEYQKASSPTQPFYVAGKDMSPSEAVEFGAYMSDVRFSKKLPGKIQTESYQKESQQRINIASEVFGEQERIGAELTANPESFIGMEGVATEVTGEGTIVSLSPEFMESQIDYAGIKERATLKTKEQLEMRPIKDIIGSRFLEVGVGGAQALIGLGEYPFKLTTTFGMGQIEFDSEGKRIPQKKFKFDGILGDIRDQPTGTGTFLGKSLMIVPLAGAGIQTGLSSFSAERIAGATRWGALGTVSMETLASAGSPIKIQSGIIGTAYSQGLPKQVGTGKTDFLKLGDIGGKQYFTAAGKATYTTPTEFTYGSIKYGWGGITPKITTITGTNIQAVGFGKNIFESTPASQYGSEVQGRGFRDILNIRDIPVQTSRYTFDTTKQVSFSKQSFKGWGTGVTTPEGFSVGEGSFYFTPKTTDVFTTGYKEAQPTYFSIKDSPVLTKGEGISLGQTGKPYQVGEFTVTPGEVASFLTNEDVGIYMRTDTKMFVKGSSISDKDAFGIGGGRDTFTGETGGQRFVQTPKIDSISEMSGRIITAPTTMTTPTITATTSQISGAGLVTGIVSKTATDIIQRSKTITVQKPATMQKPSVSSALSLSTIQKNIVTPTQIITPRTLTTTTTGLITPTITQPVVTPVIAPTVTHGTGWTSGLVPIVPIIGIPPYIPKLSLSLGKKSPTRKIKGIPEGWIGSSYAAKVFDIRSKKEAKGTFGGMFTGMEIKPLTLKGEVRIRKKGTKPKKVIVRRKKTKKKKKR